MINFEHDCFTMKENMTKKRNPNGYWSKNQCRQEALKYETPTQFFNSCPVAYAVAAKKGWLPEICANMKRVKQPNGYWTKDRVFEIVALCDDFAEFRNKYPSARGAAQRNGWMDEVRTMLAHKTYWSFELCKEEVRKHGYKSRKDFNEGSPGCYGYAQKHGFLDELCKEMEPIGHYNKRKIYVYEFEDGYAYVGLAGNPKKRKYEHTTQMVSPVMQHIEQTHAKYEYKMLSGWLTKEEAAKFEDEMINKYAADGWKMLNKKKGGALGSARKPIYTLNELKAAVSTCDYRVEVKRKYPSMYDFILRHGLLEEVLGWMPKFHMSPLRWDDKSLWKVVEECNCSKKTLQSKYPGAYSAIAKQGRIKEFFGSYLIKRRGRTIESAIEECKQYDTLKELRLNNQSLYNYIHNHKIQDTCFARFRKNNKQKS